jgi:hypothetical protein
MYQSRSPSPAHRALVEIDTLQAVASRDATITDLEHKLVRANTEARIAKERETLERDKREREAKAAAEKMVISIVKRCVE